jgi:EAL domain-containing protein (putative c-di-GMP-specific phosphodiesterase class I)
MQPTRPVSKAALSKPIPLLRLADRLRQQHAGKSAVLVDVSGIANIDSRIVFRSVARFIEERTLGEPMDAVSLARNMLVLLAPPEASLRIVSQLEKLGEDLKEQHQGTIRARVFDLEKQSAQFVETARQLMEVAPAPRSERIVPLRDEAAPDLSSLSRIIDLNRILGQADLANQCRRQFIWRLQHNTAPTVLADEIWVSISAVEQITGIALRDNIWLLGKATELLDQRLMAQVATDWAHMTRPLSINLHLVTVVSKALLRLISERPTGIARQLMVEIPAMEWRSNPPLAASALQLLRQHDIRLCLDGIGPDDVRTLKDQDWRDADYLKFDLVAGLRQQQLSGLQALSAEQREMLHNKGIFCHCDTLEAVAGGLELGVQYFHGRMLTPLLDDAEAMTRLLGVTAADGAALALKNA